MMKKFNPKRKPANLGISFVQRIADEMDCVWRPTPNDDVGLDGEIELGKDGAATARLIKVQVKSGSSYIKNSTGTGFDYYASPDDLIYWNSANLPVILVVYDPMKDEDFGSTFNNLCGRTQGRPTKGGTFTFPAKEIDLL